MSIRKNLVDLVVGASAISGGWAAGFAGGLFGGGALGTITGAALAGGVSSAISSSVYGSFSWDNVLKGAFAGIVTSGLDRIAQSLSLPDHVLINAGSQAVQQGIASELLGEDFATGALSGLISQITSDMLADIDLAIAESNLTSAQATVARQSARLVTSAIRIANTDGHPAQLLAQELVSNLTELIVAPIANDAFEAGFSFGSNVSELLQSLGGNTTQPLAEQLGLQPGETIVVDERTQVLIAEDGTALILFVADDGTLIVKDEQNNTVLELSRDAQQQSGLIPVNATAETFDSWFLDGIEINISPRALLNMLTRLGTRAVPILLLGLPTNTTQVVHISEDGQFRYHENLGEFGKLEQYVGDQWVVVEDGLTSFDALTEADRNRFNAPLAGPASSPDGSEQTPPFPDQSDEVDGTSDGFPADDGVSQAGILPGTEITDPHFSGNILDRAILANNLERGGAFKPDSEHQAHHIIPQGDARSDYLRDLLSEAGININDPRNGIWLPRNGEVNNPGAVTPHNQTLRQTYFDYLEDKFAGASSEDVPQLLAEVKRDLDNGRRFEYSNNNNR